MTHPTTYASSFDNDITATIQEAAQRVTAFRNRLSAADLQPHQINSAATLDRLPVTSKDQLLEAQRADPPLAAARLRSHRDHIVRDHVRDRALRSPFGLLTSTEPCPSMSHSVPEQASMG